MDSNAYHMRIRAVLDHIQARLDQDLSIAELAEVAGFSAFHFHRLFKGLVGETLMGYVRRLRLERAAHRLRYTEQPLIEIALDSGYETQESFTRSFKSVFGEPPARYRRLNRPLPHLPVPSEVSVDFQGTPRVLNPMASTADDFPDVQIEKRATQTGVRIRHVGPYDQVGSCFEALAEWAGERGLYGPGTVVCGLAFDDPAVTAPEQLRYDACIVFESEEVPDFEAPFESVSIAGGEYATYLHEGSYEQLSTAYERIVGAWLPQSGRELRHAPCLELYLNDPQIVPADELQTLICLPLEASQ